MSKPNSVQWFLDKLIEHRIIIVDQTTYGDKVKPKHEILLEQAKAMHKEEIIDSHESGMADGYYFEGSQSDYESEGATKYFGEQHYEQTFGGNK